MNLGTHEIQDLLLPLGQFALVSHGRPLGIEHLYAMSVATIASHRKHAFGSVLA
jgi:hypothetical protein